MLVLTRKKNERLEIYDRQTNETLTLTVVSLSGNRVRLGLEASERYMIMRSEVTQRQATG